MARILILKGDRSNTDSECYRTYKGLASIGLDDYFLALYQNIIIEMSENGTVIYYNDDDGQTINILDFDIVYLRDFHGYEAERNVIAYYLKANKHKFVNSDIADFQAISKLEQCIKFNISGIAIPKTLYASRILAPSIVGNYPGYPCIVKSIYASSGNDNYLVKSEDELDKVLQNSSQKMIFQEFIPNDGDFRIVVVGDSIATIALRESSNKDDHRNNISLGGKKTYLEIESIKEEDKLLAIHAAKVLGREICGVDLLKSSIDGKSYILEGNFNFGIQAPDNITPKELFGLAEYFHKLGAL